MKMALACQLAVPVHRGSHAEGHAFDLDLAYPDAVKAKLAAIAAAVVDGEFCANPAALVEELDVLSRMILARVASFQWTLTRDGLDYAPTGWDEDGTRYLRLEPVVDERPIRLRLGSPVPADPVMVDYHSLPSPVVSQRVRDVLAALPQKSVQLVPADVRVRGDDVRRYYLVHVYQRIAAVDRARSVLDVSPSGRVAGIQHMVLDLETLSQVPLEERLVFRLAESVSVHLFHETVVDAVLALQPEGLRFTAANGWSDSAGFQAGAAR